MTSMTAAHGSGRNITSASLTRGDQASARHSRYGKQPVVCDEDTARGDAQLERLFKMAMVVIACVLVGFLGMFIGRAFAPADVAYVSTYQVKANDSLTSIAQLSNIPGTLSQKVARIKELNNLTNSTILEGEKLLIPQQNSDS